MIRSCFASILFCLSLSGALRAQDGGQLYGLYCAACHGAEGEGATGGAFPPLAESPWVEGDPGRAISIVLKGLTGPVEVNGKPFNLEMPPQGTALDDSTIAAILTYVRSSWGNKADKLTPEMVKVVRESLTSRDDPWTAGEILKLYPLPQEKSALSNLTSRVYRGQWNQMPDFDKIEAENVEEEHNGLIDLSITRFKDNYGIVWEGDFQAPKEGTYVFFVDADDGARIVVDGIGVAEVKGTGPVGKRARSGKIDLNAGSHPIRIEYFQAKHHTGLIVGWKVAGPKSPYTWLTKTQGKPQKKWPDIILKPEEGKTAIYRNFIAGTSPRAICFGFPGGVNLAYSADHLAPELLWKGQFMNAGRHWTVRGQGSEPPPSDKITKLTQSRFLPDGARFKGYSLDPSGNPTFRVAIGKSTLTDSWKPGATGTLVRILSLENAEAPLTIPTGNATATGVESILLTPGTPAEITYDLN
ncbi:MAG: PA14 domain-containing protein [Luteolibacter sp.]